MKTDGKPTSASGRENATGRTAPVGPPGDVVIAAGQPADFLYVILGGEARVLAKRGARPLRVGDYFGELALLDSEPRSAFVVAAGELHVIKFPRHVLREIVARDPEIALGMMTVLARRIRRLERAAGGVS